MDANIKAIATAAAALGGVAAESILSTGMTWVDALIGVGLIAAGAYLDHDIGLILLGFGVGYGGNAGLKLAGL